MKETIIQFGEGNFLRGFADYFIHKLNEKGLYEGKVVIVQPIEQGLCNLINAQKGEYHLLLRGIENGEAKCEQTKITSISRAVNPYTHWDEYLALARNPDMRFIISNTTEAGIAFDESCQPTDAPPSSFPGKLTLLLFERFRAGLSGMVVLSCELIDHNGVELKKCVLRYAAKWQLGEDFFNWVIAEMKFCNTLVDRIVTGYPKDEIETLTKQIGYEDKLLDTAELFHLWVIEGYFEKELPLQEAGFHVIWTDDVSGYKKRKVRVLNGAHTSMVCPALLAGLETVGACMKDEDILAFLHQCLYTEILPVLGETEDNTAFAQSVEERFRNPFIKHLLTSIALNSVSKFAVRVLPTILEYKKQFDEYPKALVFSFAALLYFYKHGQPNDERKNTVFLKEASAEEILANTGLWGADLKELLPLVEAGLHIIEEKGIQEAIRWSL